MTDLQGWQAVAREIGDYSLGWSEMEKCDPNEGIGHWLPAEAAAKEIQRLRERVAVLEKVREAGSKVEALLDDPEHTSNEYYNCKSIIWPRQASCDCGAQDQLDAMNELREALAAAERQQETDR